MKKKITREMLIYDEWVQISEERKGTEVWAYYNKRIKWNPRLRKLKRNGTLRTAEGI